MLDELELYQYPLPMLVEPRTLKNNRDTGYLTRKDSVILKNNHHDDNSYCQHLNGRSIRANCQMHDIYHTEKKTKYKKKFFTSFYKHS